MIRGALRFSAQAVVDQTVVEHKHPRYAKKLQQVVDEMDGAFKSLPDNIDKVTFHNPCLDPGYKAQMDTFWFINIFLERPAKFSDKTVAKIESTGGRESMEVELDYQKTGFLKGWPISTKKLKLSVFNVLKQVGDFSSRVRDKERERQMDDLGRILFKKINHRAIYMHTMDRDNPEQPVLVFRAFNPEGSIYALEKLKTIPEVEIKSESDRMVAFTFKGFPFRFEDTTNNLNEFK